MAIISSNCKPSIAMCHEMVFSVLKEQVWWGQRVCIEWYITRSHTVLF